MSREFSNTYAFATTVEVQAAANFEERAEALTATTEPIIELLEAQQGCEDASAMGEES